MAQVPDKVLAWLCNALSGYDHPDRSYADIVNTLSTYPSTVPRTEVYTFENGTSELLLALVGTLPVAFRGTPYRFPIKIWVPRTYPQEPPMVFVNPGPDMLVRPGQHVSVDGRVYHPYLRDWMGMWDRASIVEFLGFLQQAFSKEPPVLSRTQPPQSQGQLQSQPRQMISTSPAPPQLPPKRELGSVDSVSPLKSELPPPRPPKPGEVPAVVLPDRTSSRNIAEDGPPLPPLPPEQQRESRQQPVTTKLPNGNTTARPLAQTMTSQLPAYANGRPSGPPLPPLPPQQYNPLPRRHIVTSHDRSPVSPVSPVTGYPELAEANYVSPAPFSPQQIYPLQSHAAPYPPQQSRPPTQMLQQPPPMHYQQHHSLSAPSQQPQGRFRPQPPPDLLSDPSDVALPASNPSQPGAPAPPVPLNPEKEHLLAMLSQTLVPLVQQCTSQALSAVAPLQAQHLALQTAHSRLSNELRQLSHLSATLTTNEAILRSALAACDATIAHASSQPQPPIDEVLVAPTLVANQLWTLCAEEAGCREAMFVLQRAVDRGRVSGEVFVRQMRGLGREAFLKMALARKCARGLGLEVEGGLG